MLPYITIGPSKIPTFSLFVIIGILTLVFWTMVRVMKIDKTGKETFFVIPKLFIALGSGYFGAVFFDALFKIKQNGGLHYSGIMFYGGVIAGVGTLIGLIALRRKRTKLSLDRWLELLTVPFIVFHAIGRIGCFFGGCCYGKYTDGFLGVAFPDNPEAGIYHNGQRAIPTQLLEAAGLVVMAITLSFVKKNKFKIYCVAYAVMRFGLEFLRGDNRGAAIPGLSPSQFIAIAVVLTVIIYGSVVHIKSKHVQKSV